MARLKLSLLGTFTASLDDQHALALRSAKERALLAYLVVEAEQPHARESRINLLWPDQDLKSPLLRMSIRSKAHLRGLNAKLLLYFSRRRPTLLV